MMQNLTRSFILVFICAGIETAQAQLTLDRQVISCFALNAELNGNLVCSTAGQPEFTTMTGETGFLTQGFEQPRALPVPLVQYEVFFNECNETYTMNLIGVQGCMLELAEISWNEIPGTVSGENLPALTTLSLTAPDCSYTGTFDFTSMEVLTVPCEVTFYNYLSPNGDMDNDLWIIDNITDERFATNVVTIYNRWGGVVWNSNNYNNSDRVWSGQGNNGNDLPDGTYYYDVSINGVRFTGFIELVR